MNPLRSENLRALLIPVLMAVFAGIGVRADEIASKNAGGAPVQDAHPTLSLDGEWTVTPMALGDEGETGYKKFLQTNGEHFKARVPGEVHLDLMRAGKMDDPDISDNARKSCRWPENHSWWYRTEFNLPAVFLKNLRQRLVFEGIDLFGQIFVNGRLVGTSKDAFATMAFDVKRQLREGRNELVVRVTSGTELVPEGDRGTGFTGIHALRSFDQRRFLRKPAFEYGWDWCDPLPNIGLWRGVRLEGRSKIVIDHLRLDTVIRDSQVSLEGEVTLENLHPWSEFAGVLELEAALPGGKPVIERLALDVPVGRTTVPCRLVIPDPQLWWPNGMGAQPIYRLTARLVCGEEETDRGEQNIGLRTIELDRSRLADGSRFVFKVNGKEVFCKGGNWAPADMIPARIEPERYRKLVAEAKNAHFTMFRVNGVGLYESDEFYDACDRAGILLWQDFTFSCFQYPDDDPEFLALVRNEVEGVVKRLRHHPSLALWSGNNECLLGMADWWDCDPNKPEEIGGVRIYNQVLPDVCRFYDPARPYWPGSPFGGANPNSETSGDCHWWYTFGNSPDVMRRVRHEIVDECRARFVSEYGILGPPNLASVRQFLKPDELSRESTGWKIHTNSMERGITAIGINYHYGEAKNLSLPDFLLYGQMVQAMTQGGAMEAMRFRKNDPKADCQGALVWSYNDCWGETGWSIIDHYIRRKASYYWVKRACAPVKVIVRGPDGRLITRVVNDTLDTFRGTVGFGWVRLDGSAREFQEMAVAIPANGMVEIANIAVPSKAERDPREWAYAATLTGKGFPESQAVWLMAPHRELALAKPEFTAIVHDGVLEVSSRVYCHGVHLEDSGHEVLADNYFDLLPGIPLRIPITTPTKSGAYPLKAVKPIGSPAQ
jgi:beta-mannosidase